MEFPSTRCTVQTRTPKNRRLSVVSRPALYATSVIAVVLQIDARYGNTEGSLPADPDLAVQGAGSEWVKSAGSGGNQGEILISTKTNTARCRPCVIPVPSQKLPMVY